MRKYGEAAIKAVKLLSENISQPKEAWEKATIEIFGKGTESQRKSCPRCAFLGLCMDGKIRGIKPDNYTNSKKNKEYALKAVKILRDNPVLTTDPKGLWKRAIEGKDISYNDQMDVVISLWKNKLIES